MGSIARGDDLTTQSASIRLLENGAADQFHVAIAHVDPPEQARGELWPGGFHVIAVRPALVFAHLDQFLLEIVKRHAIGRLENQVGNLRTWYSSQRPPTPTVRMR